MAEQACQALESVLSPLLEGLLCETATTGGLSSLAAVPGPYNARACVELLLEHKDLCHERFPVTIRRRLEGAAAVSGLQSDAWVF